MATKKTAAEDPTPAVETTPPPAAAETVQIPATSEGSAAKQYTRGVIVAGAAGLLAAGGLAGFGIGHATGDNNGPEFTRISQGGPGQGPGWGGQRGPRGDGPRNSRPAPDQDNMPDGGSVPPAPGNDDQPGSDGT